MGVPGRQSRLQRELERNVGEARGRQNIRAPGCGGERVQPQNGVHIPTVKNVQGRAVVVVEVEFVSANVQITGRRLCEYWLLRIRKYICIAITVNTCTHLFRAPKSSLPGTPCNEHTCAQQTHAIVSVFANASATSLRTRI